MKRILVVGANSAIAEATARRFAKAGAQLFLLARDQERLSALAGDLRIRGASAVHIAEFDAEDFASHPALIGRVLELLGGIDAVLVAHGTLGDQRESEQDFQVALRELNTNALSVISLLTPIANHMEGQRSGTIAVIGSVAGDRGRQSNYIYGTAKAAVATYLQGLRNRLYRHGVHVVTIKPGFVDTPMTAGFKKSALWAKPEAIAAGIESAMRKRKDVAYLPGFWWAVMFIIRSVPERIFKRLSL